MEWIDALSLSTATYTIHRRGDDPEGMVYHVTESLTYMASTRRIGRFGSLSDARCLVFATAYPYTTGALWSEAAQDYVTR